MRFHTSLRIFRTTAPAQAMPTATRPVPIEGSQASPEKKVNTPQPTRLSTNG